MNNDSAQGVAHMVYFTLTDASDAKQQSLIDDCRRYLSNHEGVVHFSAGRRGSDFTRAVNDSEFHVALVVVFDSRAAHDAYQEHPEHVEFVTRNKDNWASVRVFDAYV